MGSAKTKHKHIHKVKKVGPIWKCARIADNEDCTFFVYFRQEHVLFGRLVICWGCEEVFKFNENNLNEDEPLCHTCRHPELLDIEAIIAEKEREAELKRNIKP